MQVPIYLDRVKYIRSHVEHELHDEQRKYSTDDKVGIVIQKLVDNIRAEERPDEKKKKPDSWRPEFIIGWVDERGVWKGSSEVAKRLSDQFGGVPTLIVTVKDVPQVTVTDPSYEVVPETLAAITIPEGARRGLLVDDAIISGSRLATLSDTIKGRFPDIELRTAVLSAKRGIDYAVKLDYRGDMHEADDVLFPWGWARTPALLYAYYHELGTRDRRFMPREPASEGRAEVISIMRNEDGATVFETRSTTTDAMPFFDLGSLHDDHLLYVSNGSVKITVGSVSGSFSRSEFLYVPFVVPYQVAFETPDTVLLTNAFRPSDEELMKRKDLPEKWDERQPGETWRAR